MPRRQWAQTGRGPSTYEVEGPLSSAAPATRSSRAHPRPGLTTRSQPNQLPQTPRLLGLPSLVSRRAQPAQPLRESSPNSRTAGSTEHANIDSGSSWQPSVDSMPASPEGAFPGVTRQVVNHLRTPQPLARLRELPAASPADPGFGAPFPVTVSGGVGDFYRCQTRRARGPRTRLWVSLFVHRNGRVTPMFTRVIHRLSTGSSTPIRSPNTLGGDN
jgi:hypothetical protein